MLHNIQQLFQWTKTLKKGFELDGHHYQINDIEAATSGNTYTN